jgi:hypothetical protein
MKTLGPQIKSNGIVDDEFDLDSLNPLSNAKITEFRNTVLATPEVPNYNDFYGVQWDSKKPTTALQRIGNMDSHLLLPVQSLMKRCVVLDSGEVNYYLDSSDSTLKEDGVTPAVLDGTDGQIMVEIPTHYRKFETFGTISRVYISMFAINGFKKIPKTYISAYEASLNRTNDKLSSVVNLSTDYRGGDNSSAWDNKNNSLLGKPVTNISRTNFRNYARNRGLSNWNLDTANSYKTYFYLYLIEYAEMNSQTDFNPVTNDEGYKQGGLGKGVTSASNSEWSSFNSYNPFVPCGITNSLGNNSGNADYAPTGWADNQVFQANSYRGIENPFGHIWKWLDGINIRIQADADGGKSEVYVANGVVMSDKDYLGYIKVGEASRSKGYIKEMIIDQLIAKNTSGASSSTYWSDYFYTSIPSSGESLRGVLSGGSASSGTRAGFGCSYTIHGPSSTLSTFGSRLCFLTEID